MHWNDDETRREVDGRLYKKLWEAVNRLYAFDETLDEFPAFLCALIAEALDSDLADYGEYHPASKQMGGTFWTPGSNYAHRIEAHMLHMHKHPVFTADPNFYKERALGNRDFFTDGEFFATPLYLDSFKPDGLRHFLNICLPCGGWIVSHGVYRQGTQGYSRKEQALFSLLWPHIQRCHELARARTLDRLTLMERIEWLYPALGKRHRQVMYHVARGKSNEAVARCLNLDVNTVKTYLKVLFDVLDVANRTELAVLAHQRPPSMFLPSRAHG